MGAAGTSTGDPVDDEFNRVSFLSHFDGENNGVNNVFDDGSASNHTITANGNATQGSFGPFARPDGEWGWSFDGDGDSLTFTNDATMSLDGDYTFELFFNARTIVIDTQHPNIFLAGTTQLYINASSKYVGWYASSADIVKSADDSILTNVWNHVAVVRSGTGSNNTSLYLNGTRVAQTQNTATLGAGSGTTRIGSYSAAGGNFNGHISNIRILKGTALYSGSSITVPTSKLTAVTNTKLLTCQSNRFIDNSSTGFALTPVGNAAVTSFGPFLTNAVYDSAVNGTSLATPAAGDYLSFSNIGLDGHSGDFSVEAWVYPTSYASAVSPIYSQGSATSISDILDLSLNASGQPLVNINQGTTTIGATFVCPKNAWTFVQFKRTSGTLAILTNGVQRNTVSNTATIGSPNRGHVGTQSYDVGASNRSFYGFICDVRVSVVTRSVSLPTAPLAVIDSNTKLLLNMADAQAIDSAAQAEWTGTTVANGTPKLQTGQKKIGTSSLYFDGSSNYYFPNGFLPGGTGDFTIEFWFRASNTNDNATILTAGGIYFQFYNNQLWYFPYNGGAKITSSTISTNTWYHVAGVRSGTTFYLFLGGTSQGTLTSVTAAVSNGAGYFGMNGIYPYTGYIDEMRISRMARYTSNFTPATEPFADKGR
jgi:hypothetical protein